MRVADEEASRAWYLNRRSSNGCQGTAEGRNRAGKTRCKIKTECDSTVDLGHLEHASNQRERDANTAHKARRTYLHAR